MLAIFCVFIARLWVSFSFGSFSWWICLAREFLTLWGDICLLISLDNVDLSFSHIWCTLEPLCFILMMSSESAYLTFQQGPSRWHERTESILLIHDGWFSCYVSDVGQIPGAEIEDFTKSLGWMWTQGPIFVWVTCGPDWDKKLCQVTFIVLSNPCSLG